MATKPKAPPKQLRVTFQEQTDHKYDDTGNYLGAEPGLRLGFATAYAPTTAAYAKAKETQDNWAYEQWNQGCYEKDGAIWVKKWRWNTDFSPAVKEHTEEIVAPDLQPIIIDNVPLEGFKIQHMVARHRGNKLWRILDPRGFELEILSGCFEDIVMTGVVDRGLIIGPCIWRTGKILERVSA